ncbi:CBF-domain-containing protein, partial [Piedraia hortae CBS 480.64]
LLLSIRTDWHAVLPPSISAHEISIIPSQKTLASLHTFAHSLLEKENEEYDLSHRSGSSSQKFLTTIMASGTLEDRVSALTLLVQESPAHGMKAFDNLLGLARKRNRSQALMAVAALKDLLGRGGVLPDRKLWGFGRQGGLIKALGGSEWTVGSDLPVGNRELMLWAYEDWLKKKYFEFVQILEGWCGDEVEYTRNRAVTYVWELLRDKPEQEENLLRLLVNKLGDKAKKVASRASYLLLQLENSHPAMKGVVTKCIEADCLFRPGQSDHARYYAIITLNQTILSQREPELANALLGIYFALFNQLLKPVEKEEKVASRQGGGGRGGKAAAKKVKAQEQAKEAEVQLREKMIAQVLIGVNRTFPYSDTDNAKFEQQLDTIFRVAHSSNFNTSVQALMLIQQISSTKRVAQDRFYKTLYTSLLDMRLLTSSKQVMYLNLLYKSLKDDSSEKRVQAFVKRLLQVITMHEPPFACGVLYLIVELEKKFPSIRSMIEKAAEDGDEQLRYDSRKRNPMFARAEGSCLWDLLPFLQHYHPSVVLFAETLLLSKPCPPKPDPANHTLIHFLDRFVYRNPKSKPSGMHGASIMQPMGGSANRPDMLIRPGGDALVALPVNNEAFWKKKADKVAADEIFFHSYFNQLGGKRKKTAKAEKAKGGDSEDDEGEDEIWKALVNSRPEIEGGESEDDISVGDLEDAYESETEGGSEGGLDLGGDDEDLVEMDGIDVQDEDDEAAESEEEPTSKKKQVKRKLKSLPTFADAESYAKLLADD